MLNRPTAWEGMMLMNRTEDAIFFYSLIFSAGELILFALFVIALYYRQKCPPLQIYITDFWAAIAGLTPSYIVLIGLVHSSETNLSLHVIAFAELLCYQVLGMTTGLLLSKPHPEELLPRRLDQFFLICGGGLCSTLLPFIANQICCLNCFVIIVALPFYCQFVLGRQNAE